VTAVTVSQARSWTPAVLARQADEWRRCHDVLDRDLDAFARAVETTREGWGGAAADAARGRGVRTHVGPIFSADSFYPARPELGQRLAAHGVLAVEMEAAALYTIAAAEGRRALAICTVSDHLITGEDLPAAAREQSFSDMVHIALDTVRDA